MNYKNISFGSIDKFNVIIETPKGSENKYEYNEDLDAIEFNWSFKGGFCFPFDYGFIPQTLAEDSDTADVFVITGHHFPSGIIVECKAIGIIEVLDRGKEDNKIIAVPLYDPEYSKYDFLKDLSFDYKTIFENFFKELGIQKSKKIEVTGFNDATAAKQYIEKTNKNFNKTN